MYNKKALSDAISKLNAAKAPKQEPDRVVNFDTKPFVSNQGYKQGPPPSNTHYRIPGDTIYNPTPYPLKAISSNGLEAFIPAYDTTNYTFPGADYVDEIPMAKRGGAKRLPKGKTKSLSGVNKLMIKNPLFRSYGHKLFDPSHHSFQPGGEKFVDSEPKNDFVYINRQVEVSPNNYTTQQVAVPKNNTNLYKPVPLNTENLISYLELKEKYPDIHEKVKSDWQKNPDRMPFEEYAKDAGWEQLTTTENIKQPYKGNKKWEELVESCPECLLMKGQHFERDEQGNVYLVQNPVKFPLDFWEKMYDENYNIEDFINIDTGVKEENSVLKEVVSTPQEYKNLRYHQEWNPFTKSYEAMSPKQHMMLDREAYKLQNKGVQPTPDNMPVFQNRELLDEASRKPIGTRSWNTGSGWSWQEGDIIGNNSEKLPNTSGKRLMNKKRKKLITQPDNENNFVETDLTEEEIEQYKKEGFIIEELPQAQKGSMVQRLLQRAKEQSEKPGFKTQQFAKEQLAPNVPTSRQEAEEMMRTGELKYETYEQRKARNEREAAARKAEREASLKAYEQRQANPEYSEWTGLPGENFRDMLANEAASLDAKFRFSQEDNFFDDYLNPAVWIGSMAKGLGEAPKQAKETNSIMPYVTSIGAPLLGGALGSLGTKTTGQFVNNLVNPLAGVNIRNTPKQLPGSGNAGAFANIPKASKETIEDAQQFLQRRQFIKELQKKELIGKGFNTADLNYSARNTDRTNKLTQLALNRDATRFRGVMGEVPVDGKGFADYSGYAYDMSKPAYGNKISEFENMRNAGVDFNDPVSIAKYQASHVPMQEYGYRAGMPRSLKNVDALYTDFFPTNYGNYQIRLTLPRDYSTGNYQTWFDRYYKPENVLSKQAVKDGYYIRDFLPDVPFETPISLSSTNRATLIGKKGERLLDVDETFPFMNYRNLSPSQQIEFNNYKKQLLKDYYTGWRGQYMSGGFVEAELTKKQIEQLRKQGYTIEEL